MTELFKKVTIIQLEWLGSALALSGAIIFATNSDFTKFGYIPFLLSGVVFLVFGYRKKYQGIITMQLGFILVNIVGIYNWVL